MSEPKEILVLPSQLEFLQDNSPQLLLSGSYGSGKTRALCLKAAIQASHKGARVLLCRETYTSLVNSTLKTLLEDDGELPAILPKGSYELNKMEHCAKIKNGGEIIWTGFDKSEKILSMNLTWIGVDEGIELETAKIWNDLNSRLRLKVNGTVQQIATATNPGSPEHFLYKKFIGLTKEKGTKVIYSTIFENQFLLAEQPNYIEHHCPKDPNSIDYQRYVLGKWVSLEGLVYKSWEPSKFITNNYSSGRDFEDRRFVAGIDWGYSNNSAIEVIGFNNKGKIRLFDEWCQKETSEKDLVEEIKKFDKLYHFEYLYYDHSNSQLGDLLTKAGLPAEKADKSVIEGISCCSSYIRLDNDKPVLTVSTNCSEFAKEIVNYQWDDKKDKPIKKNDHCLDAFRYGMVGADKLINQGEVILNLGKLY